MSFTTVVRHCDEDAQPVLCIVPCIKYVLTFSRSFCHRCDSQVALAVVKIKPSTGLLLRSSILPQALNLAASPLLQDLALDSLLELFEAMIIADIVSVQ